MNRRVLVLPGRALAAISAACLAAAATGGGPAAAGATTHARVIAGLPGTVAAAASVPHTSDLNAVAATSAGNAWAVGFRYNGTADLTLVEHWNGRSWREVPSPDRAAPSAAPAISCSAWRPPRRAMPGRWAPGPAARRPGC
jgi:hypothetical protein